MKLRGTVILFLCIGLTSCLGTTGSQVDVAPPAPEAKITVLNPMGTPPPIQAKQMAPRLDTLEGKTIYFVNTGYIGTDRLMDVMSDWFKANYPKTNVVIKRSAGGMTRVDEALWAEIGEKGDAAIVGLGH
jgi:hypothetical protein